MVVLIGNQKTNIITTQKTRKEQIAMSENNNPNVVNQSEALGTFVTATIRGTVVRKIRTAKSLIFAVASANQDAKKTDFPRFVAFENLSEFDKTFSIGDRVTVVAHFRTSKKYPEGTLVPDSITVEKSRLDAVFANEDYLPDVNQLAIRGVMASDAYAPSATATLASIMVTQVDGQKAYIRTIAFGHIAASLRKKKKGDNVDVIGYIRTKPSAEAKERSHTQSVVITAMR